MALAADWHTMTNHPIPSHDPLLESIVDALIVPHDSPLTVDLRLNGILREALLRRPRTPPSVDEVESAPEWAHNFHLLAPSPLSALVNETLFRGVRFGEANASHTVDDTGGVAPAPH